MYSTVTINDIVLLSSKPLIAWSARDYIYLSHSTWVVLPPPGSISFI